MSHGSRLPVVCWGRVLVRGCVAWLGVGGEVEWRVRDASGGTHHMGTRLQLLTLQLPGQHKKCTCTCCCCGVIAANVVQGVTHTHHECMHAAAAAGSLMHVLADLNAVALWQAACVECACASAMQPPCNAATKLLLPPHAHPLSAINTHSPLPSGSAFGT